MIKCSYVIFEKLKIGGDNMNMELELNGLNCTNCAEKIESMSRDLDGVENVDFNFVTKKLRVVLKNDDTYESVRKEITDIVNKLEPEVEVIEVKKNKLEQKAIKLELNGLNCTDCAAKIQDMVRDLKGVEDVDFNFVTKKLEVDLKDEDKDEILKEEIKKIVKKLEPDVEIIDLNTAFKTSQLSFKLEGLDCADCASNIEKFTKSLKGVEDASIDFLKATLKVTYRKGRNISDLKDEIIDIVNTIEPEVKVIELGATGVSNRGESKSSILDKIDKRQVTTIVVSALIAVIPKIFGLTGGLRFLVFLTSYLIIGNKIIRQAFINVRAGVPFDENFLMTVATIGAFIIGEYPEAIMVMLLYQVGETLQGIAVNHSRDSISQLMDIRPDYANLEIDGKEVEVDPGEVKIGDVIIVKPGERVPLDGLVIEGSSSLDTSNITGESVPRTVKVGEELSSGVVNLQGLLRVKVTKEFGESTISKILDLVENASSKKAETENFITKFSRYYTPIVVFLALAVAILPPLLSGGTWGEWIYVAAVFLVISCPCALVISVPLGFFGGLGGASKAGILVKGGNYLEALADVETVVFDKTGTITEGVFTVTDILAYGNKSEDELLKIAAYGERYSNHPIGRSIVDKFGDEIDESRIENYKEIPGKGIAANIFGENYFLGNKSLMVSNGIEVKEIDSIGTVVFIGKDKEHIGTIVVSDRIKETAKKDLKDLKDAGVKKLVMLSGDNKSTVNKVASLVNIDKAYGNLLPQDKVSILEEILEEEPKAGKVAFVGDGVNDAPVLVRADVGIAMGGLGSDAAIEASDVVIMTDDLGKIAKGIKIGRNTRKIVRQNIVLALGIKILVLSLGLFGKATMIEAVFSDVGVSIIAILNSIRALNIKE